MRVFSVFERFSGSGIRGQEVRAVNSRELAAQAWQVEEVCILQGIRSAWSLASFAIWLSCLGCAVSLGSRDKANLIKNNKHNLRSS